MKNNEAVLKNPRDQFFPLLKIIEGIVWEANADTLQFTFVSDQVMQFLGYSPEEWLAEPRFWENHIHPDDRKEIINYSNLKTQPVKSYSFEYRMMNANNAIVWIKDTVLLISEAGKPAFLRGVMLDITIAKRLSNLEHLEKNVLELNAKSGVPLQKVLSCYLSGVEALFPKMLCSILQVKNNRLYNWASPSLPVPYVQAIENLQISENGGSCGTAAFLKRQVIVSDIANDERWVLYKDIALPYNLRACWSNPVINSDGEVMGTLGMYYQEPKKPEEEELKVIERVTALLQIVLENRQKEQIINEVSLLMAQAEELAHFGNWRWDIQNNIVTWSNTLYEIYGLNKNDFKATFEGYQELLHPEDRQRVYNIIQNVLKTHEDAEFEERIVRPTGEIRNLKSWGKLKLDPAGQPLEMIGACLDITESKKTQEELQASESRLRALSDAQTNYVIRIGLDGKYTYCNKKYLEDFGWVLNDRNIAETQASVTVQPYHHHLLAEFSAKCIENPNKVFQIEIDEQQEGGGTKPTLWHFIGLTNLAAETVEIQCIGLDCTDLKNAENALKISNERYEYINMATNEAMFDWDLTTGNINWGHGFFRLFGFEITEDYTFEKWVSQVHPEDISDTQITLQGAVKNPEQSNWSGAYRCIKADGHYIFVEGTGHIIRDETGNGTRMIGAIRDITERLNYIAAIEEQNKKLLEIAFMQSHVVRAPLSRIMGLVDLIKNYPKTDIEKSKMLDYLLISAYELDEIVRTISEKTEHIDL